MHLLSYQSILLCWFLVFRYHFHFNLCPLWFVHKFTLFYHKSGNRFGDELRTIYLPNLHIPWICLGFLPSAINRIGQMIEHFLDVLNDNTNITLKLSIIEKSILCVQLHRTFDFTQCIISLCIISMHMFSEAIVWRQYFAFIRPQKTDSILQSI